MGPRAGSWGLPACLLCLVKKGEKANFIYHNHGQGSPCTVWAVLPHAHIALFLSRLSRRFRAKGVTKCPPLGDVSCEGELTSGHKESGECHILEHGPTDGDDPQMRHAAGRRRLQGDSPEKAGAGVGRWAGPGMGRGFGPALPQPPEVAFESKIRFTARRVSVYSMALFLEPKLTANPTAERLICGPVGQQKRLVSCVYLEQTPHAIILRLPAAHAWT